MNARQAEIYEAASMYYVHGETMDSIARHLGVSRSTVSRLLKEARESGVVRISLTAPDHGTNSISHKINSAFGVRCQLVSVKEGASDLVRLERVAKATGVLISDVIIDGCTMGVAWGTTLAAIVAQLAPRPTRNMTIVQLNGAANPQTSGIPYVGQILAALSKIYGARVLQFPVPAFFDYAETREAMWREQTVKRMLELQTKCDVVVFGVGAFSASVPSHVYSAGYLDPREIAALQHDGIVGDICTNLLREDGTWADIELNRRASGPSPALLKTIPRRVCAVAGRTKVPPLLGALRTGAITDLVIDDRTAELLVKRAGLS